MTCKIKICGITRATDAACAAEAGADAIGFVFTPHSARHIAPQAAGRIGRDVTGDATRVGLFVDQDAAEIEAALRTAHIDLLQFHGSEPAAFCRQFGVPYMKAFRVGGPFDVRAAEDAYEDACCLLLDAYVQGQPGGTGQRFDLSYWPQVSVKPLVLAGGLTPANVAAAITATRAFAVDVSGGVEGARKGVKEPAKISAFIEEVNRAGC